MALQLSDDTAVADWLLPVGASVEEAELTAWLGPAGFEAHARVLQLPDPAYPRQPEDEIDDDALDRMPSDVDLVVGTVTALRASTRTPDELVLLLWSGWPYRPPLPATRRFGLGTVRDYAVARGSLDDWVRWVADSTDGHGRGFAPGLLWPADRAWCLALDVDAHFAGVGASAEAITALLAVELLDVVASTRTAPTLRYG